MICPICQKGELKSYEKYYRCTNPECKIKKNKCIKAPKQRSLYPNKPRFTKEQKEAIIVIVAFILIVGGGLAASLYMTIQAAATVV